MQVMYYFHKNFFILLSFVVLLSFNSCNDDEPDATDPDPVPVVKYDYQDSTKSVDLRVADLMSRMTLKEKIGQMTQVATEYLLTNQDVATYYLGSLLSGGGSDPLVTDLSYWTSMVDAYQSKAMTFNIPLLYGIDAVHGHNNVTDAVIFPHNIGMGCTRNMQLIEDAARATAEEMVATGIPWTFAPCVAVARNIRWGRTYESYSEDPELVSLCGEAAVKGYQGTSIKNSSSVIACAKHFVGDGGTTNGINEGTTEIDEEELRSIHLPGYISAINAGVATVMVSFNSWYDEKMHQNKYLITDVLKGELGFAGFVVSDWGGVKKISPDEKNAIKQAINAGIDMVMVPDDYKSFITNLEALVDEGAVSLERINDAVERILTVKFNKGLFEHPYANSAFINQLGTDEHRDIARKCVRQSLVLLKNEGNILPLSKTINNIHVCGSIANDLGAQCGGWTIDWQGGNGDITTGTTILQGIKNLSSAGTVVKYSEKGDNAADADVAIVVVGEKTPYAETDGDREVDELYLSATDVAMIHNISNEGVPIVLVLVSGRPLLITDIVPKCDAICVAWLPGSEGDGIADVLFGDYNPTGTLCRMWPKDENQVEQNKDNVVEPLFDFGYGLQY